MLERWRGQCASIVRVAVARSRPGCRAMIEGARWRRLDGPMVAGGTVMRVVRTDDGSPQPANRPIFLGHVEAQPYLDTASEHVRLTLVRFSPGARTKMHAH